MSLVGIDLGTTHSLVAVVRDGAPVVLGDEHGQVLLPSAIALDGARPVVGRAALEVGRRHPDRLAYSIKRLMGRGLADLSPDEEHLPFDLSASTPQAIRLTLGARRFTPPELASLVLRRLKAIAEAHLGTAVERAVVTVPAYFDEPQRQATLLAGRLAGLEIVRLLNEPTAACLACGLEATSQGHVAVYDLGGGTFDCSILAVRDGVFEVLATAGDTRLGGDDVDRLIVEHLQARAARAGIAPEAAPYERWRRAAQQAKHALSTIEQVEALVELADGGRFACGLARGELEAWVGPLLGRTRALCEQALGDAGLEARAIDEVVLVGGATRMPAVKALVASLFGRPPHDRIDPDQGVALGAAIQADVLAGRRDDVLLLDVNPLTLGIETLGGAVSKLIERNTTLPASALEVYTTFVDYQQAVVVHVVQGERELAADCRSLARFEIPLEPARAGKARIEVKFALDASGTLRVTACELIERRSHTVEVRPTYGLEPADLAAMQQAGARYAQADALARQAVEDRLEAEALLRATRQGLASLPDEELPAAERSGIEAAMAELEGTDAARRRSAIEALERATQHLAGVVMRRSLNAAIAEPLDANA